MRRKVLGFTLIELMIVVAIIAIIAAIAIPGLLRARISANEGSASAGLRSLASAEVSFMKAGSVDQDNDGTGEFGIMNELTGASNRRGCAVTNPPVIDLPPLTTTDMSVALQTNANGISSKSGYLTRVWLPGIAAGGVWDDNGAALPAPTVTLDSSDAAQDGAIQQQENRWVAISWPATYRSSGVRAFVADQGAEVFASTNTDTANNIGWWYGDNASGGLEPGFQAAMYNDTVNALPTDTIWTNILPKDNNNCVDTNHTWLPTGS